MTNDQNERITAIRLRAQRERVLISELNAQLGVELNKTLELESSLLDDVEEFFLDAEILQERGLGDCPPGVDPRSAAGPKTQFGPPARFSIIELAPILLKRRDMRLSPVDCDVFATCKICLLRA